MHQINHGDSVFILENGESPDYNHGNSLVRLMSHMEATRLAAEREHYLHESLQYLFPFRQLELYGPAGGRSAAQNINPENQDNKEDFQKQNIRAFTLSDTALTRGWANAGAWTGPFLQISYWGGPDSTLAKASAAEDFDMTDHLLLWLKVADNAVGELLKVPYDPETDRYQLEIWGYPGNDLINHLDERGRLGMETGRLITAPNLIKGSAGDFAREGLNDLNMFGVAPENSMHPLHPLHIEAAWAHPSGAVWDSKDGDNYHFEFNMMVRGWDQFLKVGMSPNPHGGVGFLEYRNLLSNYFEFKNSGELGREIPDWSFDANGNKGLTATEKFMAVDYMDLHIMKPQCGIGLHRHRDNQEIFLMMKGRGLMVVGDWAHMDNRERCFEMRTLREGHFAMLKGGNMHGLMNPTDEDAALFMFGGYD
ncbi:cupin domain-containing protein [Acanthopleuribacter pedis]|uniref:Uncharacterized protein n=1 Tax=Acanthopleuribacter pedis TaxID=442870 RepID=A0A8J7QBN5_9BACT|nr:hypothetical protein [Acanthopleuribacter pedis]MBO1323167.1 hypothetical protein [Acanthopleuribacter pedis]